MSGLINGIGVGEEASILRNVTSMLSGVPPPPSLSVCSLTCAQLLEAYYNNAQLNLISSYSSRQPVDLNTPKMFYLNSGQVSEDLSDMFMKLQRRLVQSETLSTFSVKPTPPPLCTTSRIRGNSSPGRRLSHLARRRHVFSKDNLKCLAHNETKNVLTIPKNNFGPPIPKRALFQSPDDPNVRRGFRTVKRVAAAVPRRRLFNEGEKNKPDSQFSFTKEGYDVSTWLASQSFAGGRKRSRKEEKSGGSGRKRKCPRRSLEFSPPASQTSEVSHPSTDKTPNQSLTYIQKQKLLWAVSVALKEQNISHQHEYFKRCASLLFNQSKKEISKILSSPGTSTSEKMLAFTREKVKQVVSSIVPENELASKKIVIEVREDKENRLATPRRPIRNRGWKTCLKNVKKRNARLKRSVSLTDLSSLMLNHKETKLSLLSYMEAQAANLTAVNESLVAEEINFTIVDDSETINNTITTQDLNDSCLESSMVYTNAPSPDLFNDTASPLIKASQDDGDESEIVRFPMLTKLGDAKKLNSPAIEEPKKDEDHKDIVIEVEKEEKLSISSAVSETSDKLMMTCKRRASWYSEPGPGLTLKMRFAQEWAVVNSVSENGSGTPSSCSSMGSYTLMEMRDRLAIERTLQADSSDISWYSSTHDSTDEASGAESTFNVSYTVPGKSNGEKMTLNNANI